MLGKATEYAIRALVYIYIRNQQGKRPGFREIAENIDSPVQFTAKILQTLTRRAIIMSMKGRGGGFFFKDPSTLLTLYDVIIVFEGEELFNKCGFGLKSCDKDHPCPLHDQYSQIRENFKILVEHETIRSLADKIRDRQAVLSRL
jgi:Rrf2 family protein